MGIGILNDSMAKSLPVPDRGSKVYYDDRLSGFGVRVTAAGARSFILNYRTRAGRERRITIGSAGHWRCAAARDEARRLKTIIDSGGDPLGDYEAERAAPTMRALAERFEQEHFAKLRPSTARDYRLMLERHVLPLFGGRKAADIAYEDIAALHRKVTRHGAPYKANRVVALLSKMFSMAVRWKVRPDNPAKGIERNQEAKRRRYLKPDELARLTDALNAHPDQQAVNIVRLLLMTGARRGEVLAMRWDELDLSAGTWTKPASLTKQRAIHEVPLSAPARQLLSEIRSSAKRPSEYVFPGRIGGHRQEIKRDWHDLLKAANISELRLHDLRHTFASMLVSGGHSLELIGSLLGHSQASTTHRYAHLFDDPQRKAVETVGSIISAGGREAAAPVVPMPKRRR
jgi:integrase